LLATVAAQRAAAMKAATHDQHANRIAGHEGSRIWTGMEERSM
jgi:hypothetical protein